MSSLISASTKQAARRPKLSWNAWHTDPWLHVLITHLDLIDHTLQEFPKILLAHSNLDDDVGHPGLLIDG